MDKRNTWKSAIAEHQWDQQHQVDWDTTRVLDRAPRPVQLKVKEALHIENPGKQQLNRDGGYNLPGFWIVMMKKVGGGGNRASANLTSAPPSPPSAPSHMGA